jgi:hypothetical protein
MTTKHSKNRNDLFKPAKKGDRLTCAYLYADGHAVAAFERRVRDLGKTLTYYKVIDNLGVSCGFQGRIVVHQWGGMAWFRSMLAAGMHTIRGREASLDNGSPNSQAKGIPVGYVVAETPFGEVTSYEIKGVLGADLAYQPDVVEAFNPDAETFGSDAVVEILISAPAVAVAS